jgi:hypothetical protein
MRDEAKAMRGPRRKRNAPGAKKFFSTLFLPFRIVKRLLVSFFEFRGRREGYG